MLWKLPIFSFLKNVSAIQILPASINVKYLILSKEHYCGLRLRITFQWIAWIKALNITFIVLSKFLFELQPFIIPFLPECDLKLVFLTTQPILMFVEDDAVLAILTSFISEKPRTKILTNISVAASKANDHQDYPIVVIHDLIYWSWNLRISSTRIASMTKLVCFGHKIFFSMFR